MFNYMAVLRDFRRAVQAASLILLIGLTGPGYAAPSFEGYYAKFIAANPSQPVPDIPFLDAQGGRHRLSDFRGRVVLLNFWATWCPACVMEMPALDRLQGELGGADFTVLTISQNSEGPAVIRGFFQAHKLKHLPVFIDNRRRLGIAFDQDMLPTSILLDAQDREVGRLIGPAAWDTPSAIALIRHFMRRNNHDIEESSEQ